MSAFAINVLAAMFVHRVVAGQDDGSIRQQVFENPASQELGQPPTRPASLREEAAVAGGIAGNERSQGAQEVGDGVASDGQDGGTEQEREAQGRGFGEGVRESVAQRVDRSGQLVVGLAELSADGSVLASLLLPALASLGFG